MKQSLQNARPPNWQSNNSGGLRSPQQTLLLITTWYYHGPARHSSGQLPSYKCTNNVHLTYAKGKLKMKPTPKMVLSNLLKSHAAQSRLYAEANLGVMTGEYTEDYVALWREEVKITQGAHHRTLRRTRTADGR